MVIHAGTECTLTLKYQPTAADSSENFILTAMYRAGPGQYLMQNIQVSLLPRSPGFLIAEGKSLESINYKISPTSSSTTRSSYPLNIGTQILNVVPKIFNFNASSGAFQKLTIANTQPTKASLLLSYQKYLTAHSLRDYSPETPAPTSVIPDASEYRVWDGQSYVPINLMKYASGADRVLIEASKGCLFGDDETNEAIAAHQKGFNDNTTLPCHLIVTFSANFDYLRDIIQVTDGDDMRGTASELWYFSVNRSSTASFWVHIKGTINPDLSIASGTYSDVKAFENRTVSMIVPKFNPSNSDLGQVVGTRIIMGSSSTVLNDPYNPALTNYIDIKPYDPLNPQTANFSVGMSNGSFYYYRAVAIRRDFRFTIAERFSGLGPGEYLSLATSLATPLKVLVPPLNHFYFHNQKIIVEKSLHGGVAYDTHAVASNRCTSRPRVHLKSPGNVYRSYQLINLNIWDLLLSTPAATNYGSMKEISHWLSDPTTSIDTQCSAMPGFVPNNASQLLDSSFAFYFRNSANPAANVNQSRWGSARDTVLELYVVC
jgi:hypothetical protein